MREFDPIEIRVLACLVEKEKTTPEYYPLTLRALVAACNQKSNRQPVMILNDEGVLNALNALRIEKLVVRVEEYRGRVPKYAHKFQETAELDQQEMAILAELMLRGPQTMGEIKARGSRFYPFVQMIQVETALQRLGTREPQPLVLRLERAPGQKEPRFAQLLGGPVCDEVCAEGPAGATMPSNDWDRVETLESEIRELQEQLSDLRSAFDEFRRQFE